MCKFITRNENQPGVPDSLGYTKRKISELCFTALNTTNQNFKCKASSSFKFQVYCLRRAEGNYWAYIDKLPQLSYIRSNNRKLLFKKPVVTQEIMCYCCLS